MSDPADWWKDQPEHVTPDMFNLDIAGPFRLTAQAIDPSFAEHLLPVGPRPDKGE